MNTQAHEGVSRMAETDWLLEAKTAYERPNAQAAAAAAPGEVGSIAYQAGAFLGGPD
jgi:hypothetical protein